MEIVKADYKNVSVKSNRFSSLKVLVQNILLKFP